MTASFPHLSEVLKILDGALKSNASMSTNYAGLLADKLEQDGQREQAMRIRERLARAPNAIAHTQDASRLSNSLPVDSESRLYTVDVSKPAKGAVLLKLSSGTMNRISEFLESVIHYDKLQALDAAMPLRLMLYGPPGTGKTQTIKWIAGELSLPLITVRCDTLIGSLLGQTSKNLRRVFEYASETPCVLFLDEFDALANARGNERDIGELQRVVISLLQNIDALEKNIVLVAASNHEQLLDRAIWRRFPFQVPLFLPDLALRTDLWKLMLGDVEIKGLDLNELAKKSEGLSGALIEQVAIDARRHAILGGTQGIDPTEIYRRLGIALALNLGKNLNDVKDEIQWLRKWDAKIFSIRELSRLYKISTRQITHLIEDKHG
ncbi:anti-phage ATPase IteA [Polynucleobacter sphagniphilus]|uniref:ATP-dependent 26S proteasome regulatory subunit n=1 Tax=Polynucleobacter sphagniphilus TaxID=1743169 RepID=A0AA43S580_9BURK|nr:anti-phage ATPase IteA [Polynucleobacter sphagniphilus]MDH6503067.1 ATP-dependent 26S proteasome regulatory subunit [Polynucleobacter sphagniphilus]MDH6511728.1 ATP-dependent 26S proteasome regulatory subunit [Polynucleobacter sphagniphilus]OLY96647.1 AAA family ATPase [Polynucleobacter sphagniphilus]